MGNLFNSLSEVPDPGWPRQHDGAARHIPPSRSLRAKTFGSTLCALQPSRAPLSLHLPPLAPRCLQVGQLIAAHLSTNPYNYCICPQCGKGHLRLRHQLPIYSPLLLVELGRIDGGVTGGAVAASKLPWRPQVAASMTLDMSGERQEYTAAAVVYNDGGHWWADIVASGHFKRNREASGRHGGRQPLGEASYRYDGLEANGQLRYVSADGITLTSDERHISLVLYRRKPPPQADSAPPPQICEVPRAQKSAAAATPSPPRPSLSSVLGSEKTSPSIAKPNKPKKPVERRTAPDGIAYTKCEFLEYFGCSRQWDEAAPQKDQGALGRPGLAADGSPKPANLDPRRKRRALLNDQEDPVGAMPPPKRRKIMEKKLHTVSLINRFKL